MTSTPMGHQEGSVRAEIQVNRGYNVPSRWSCFDQSGSPVEHGKSALSEPIRRDSPPTNRTAVRLNAPASDGSEVETPLVCRDR